jgi:hypothetical protein
MFEIAKIRAMGEIKNFSHLLSLNEGGKRVALSFGQRGAKFVFLCGAKHLMEMRRAVSRPESLHVSAPKRAA